MTVNVELTEQELADLLEESEMDDPAAAVHAAVVGHTEWLAGRNLVEMSGRFYTQDGNGGVVREWAASEPKPETDPHISPSTNHDSIQTGRRGHVRVGSGHDAGEQR